MKIRKREGKNQETGGARKGGERKEEKGKEGEEERKNGRKRKGKEKKGRKRKEKDGGESDKNKIGWRGGRKSREVIRAKVNFMFNRKSGNFSGSHPTSGGKSSDKKTIHGLAHEGEQVNPGNPTANIHICDGSLPHIPSCSEIGMP